LYQDAVKKSTDSTTIIMLSGKPVRCSSIIGTANYFSVSGGESSGAVGGEFLMSTPQLPLLYEINPQKSIKAETANAATAIPN
jgi:hypothetical protein